MLTYITNARRYAINTAYIPQTFVIPFPYWDHNEIKVFLTIDEAAEGGLVELQEGEDYSLSAPNGSNGTLTRESEWIDGVRLTILRVRPLKQTTDFRNGDVIDADVLEHTLDTIVAQIQQLDEARQRAMTVPVDEDGTGEGFVIPSKSERAGMLLCFDSTGNGFSLRSLESFDDDVLETRQNKNAAFNAKTAAETAKVDAEDAKDGAVEAYNQTVSAKTTAVAEISSAKSTAISDISSAKTSAVSDVNSAKTTAIGEAVSAVNTAKTTAVGEIGSAKTSAIGDITTAKTSAIGDVSVAKDEAIEEIAGTGSSKEDKSNKVTSITPSSTDEQYPSAKAVYGETSRLSESITEISEVAFDVLRNINRFDFTKATDGYYVNYTTGNPAALANFFYSDFIDVSDCEKITLSRKFSAGIGGVHCYFYSDKNFDAKVSGVLLSTAEPTATVPSDAKYFVFSSNIDNKASYQVEKGEVAHSFKPYYVQVVAKALNPIDYYLEGGVGSFREELEKIGSIASKEHNYLFHIPNGTYNVLNMYTDAEKADADFVGMVVPDYVTIVGQDREKTIINASMAIQNSKVSTLNLCGTSGLKNITVKAENLRYAVHDDFATTGHTTYIDFYYRNVENCIFEAINCVYGCYGTGTRGGAIWHFKDCIFKGGFSWHSWSSNETALNSVLPNDITLENCINKTDGINGMVLKSLGSDTENHIHLIGCEIPLISCTEETSGIGFDFVIDGYGNNEIPIKLVTTAETYNNPIELSDCTSYVRYAQDMTKGNPVFKNGYNVYQLGGRSPYRMFGFAMDNKSAGSWSRVFNKGYYMASLIGLDGLADGDLVTVSSGNLAKATDSSVVIGSIETMWNVKFLRLF